ncbi:hypothetical protein [Jannaschia sp. R86511]|uniref:hypothetical protein n=1 Tax=Jannaschia sp. R86511 TaxID=3093853 RepID=UPI0036D31D2D
MKRYLVAAGAAAIAGTVVLGSAAALNVDGGQVQAGSDSSLSCQTTPVTIKQVSELDTATPYSLAARVQGVAASCVGSEISVAVFDRAGAQLARGAGDVTAAGDVVVRYGADIPLEDIENLVVTVLNG